jgi:hypothetical protein
MPAKDLSAAFSLDHRSTIEKQICASQLPISAGE